MITFERFEELNQHRWPDDEMQKNKKILTDTKNGSLHTATIIPMKSHS